MLTKERYPCAPAPAREYVQTMPLLVGILFQLLSSTARVRNHSRTIIVILVIISIITPTFHSHFVLVADRTFSVIQIIVLSYLS